MAQVMRNTYNNHGVSYTEHLWESHGKQENYQRFPWPSRDDRDDIKSIEERIHPKHL